MHQLHDDSHVPVGGDDGQIQDRLPDLLYFGGWREFSRAVHQDGLPVGEHHLVGHSGGGQDQVQVVLPFQSLLDDFQVHQPQKPAAKAETQGDTALRFHGQGGVV